MADAFDAYHKWLAIPPEEQPPNHYRLLGLKLYESDADVIANAADGRMAQVRAFQTGPQSALSQKLLNEMAAARVCLLRPGQKAAYDEKLRAERTQAKAKKNAQPKRAVALEPNVAADTPSLGFDPQEHAVTSTSRSRGKATARRKQGGLLPIVAVASVGVVVTAGLAYWFANRSDNTAVSGGATKSNAAGKPTQRDNAAPATVAAVPVTPTNVSPAPPSDPSLMQDADLSEENKVRATAAGNESAIDPAIASPTAKPSPTVPPSASLTKKDSPKFIAGKPVNLIELIDPEKDAVKGRWEKQGRELVSNNGSSAALQVPFLPPAHYVLTVAGQREDGEGLIVGLVIGGHPATLCFDAHKKVVSGLGFINGKAYTENATTKRINDLLGEKRPYKIVCEVHPDHVTVHLDDRPFLEWSGAAEAFSSEPYWSCHRSDALVLGSFCATHRIREFTLLPLLEMSTAGVAPRKAKADAAAQTRLPMPDAAAVETALALVQDVYKDDYAKAKKPAEKLALAKKLLAQAGEDGDAVQQYALLSEAHNLAIAGAGPELLVQITHQLAQRFDVPEFAALAEALDKLADKPLAKAASAELAATLDPIVDDAAAAGEFQPARRIAKIAQAAAQKAGQRDLSRKIAARVQEMAAQEKEFQAAQDAENKLKENPDDADAHLDLGKHLCFAKHDWEAGAPHLAKGSDPLLQRIGEQELQTPADDTEQIALADSLWNFAERSKGTTQLACQMRAAWWYQQAEGKLTGLNKTRVAKRLQSLTDNLATTAPKTGGKKNVRSTSGKGDAPAKEEYLRDMRPTEVVVHGDVPWTHSVQVDEIRSPHGIYTHATDENAGSRIAFEIGKRFSLFEGKVSINDGVAGSTTPLTFRVVGDGKQLWKSPLVKNRTATKEFQVNVKGVEQLELIVDCPGTSHNACAVWLEPRISNEPK